MRKFLALLLVLGVGVVLGRMFDGVGSTVDAEGGQEGCTTQNGDVNGDGAVNMRDVTALVHHLHRPNSAPPVPLCDPPELEECRAALAEATGELEECRLALTAKEEELGECQAALTAKQGELDACQTQQEMTQQALATCQQEQGPCADAEGRYLDNGDGTVTDCETGLVWQQEVGTIADWWGAGFYCDDLALGGRTNWRLPTREELLTLDRSAPGGFPFVDRINSLHWSSTSVERLPEIHAWNVGFGFGFGFDDPKRDRYLVRAVRCGP